jgi:hypothetical protein
LPPARQTPPALTLGFFGTGAMDVDHGMVLIEEFIDARIPPDDKTRWIFILTSDEYSQTIKEYAEMAVESQVAYEVITRTDDTNRRAFKEVVDAAAKVYNVDDAFLQMEQLLKEAPKSALLVLWDKEREDDMEQGVSGFLDAEIDIFDLTDAMSPIGWQPETGDTEPELEPEEPTTVGEPAAEAEQIYSRSELKEMSMLRLKEVAAELNLPPRKARETMINEILEAQGGVIEPEPEQEREQEQEQVETVEVISADSEGVGSAREFLAEFATILEGFGARFFEGLDDWLTKFSTAAEGFAFNTTPEESMTVEEPEPAPEPEPLPRRRLARRAS